MYYLHTWNRYVFTGNRIIIAPNRDAARKYMKDRGFKGTYVSMQKFEHEVYTTQNTHTVYIAR